MSNSVHIAPWDLNRKGSLDQDRHARRLKEAIVAQLPTIVGNTPMIQPHGNTIQIPIKILDLPKFRHKPPHSTEAGGVGQGSHQPKDVIARVPGAGPGGSGEKAGEAAGEHIVEVEVPMDWLEGLVFEDLSLPPLAPKPGGSLPQETWQWNSRRVHGPLATLDRKTTLKNALARSIASNATLSFHEDDLRFRHATPTDEAVSNAAIFLLRDVSGSMNDDKKYMARSMAFWLVRWLRQHYTEIRLEFWAHDAEAFPVDEAAFFSMTAAGGTRSSSVYRAMGDRVRRQYPPQAWNLFGFHFTDGEDWNPEEAAQALADVVSDFALFGLIELSPRRFNAHLGEAVRAIGAPSVATVRVQSKDDVLRGLQELLGNRREKA